MSSPEFRDADGLPSLPACIAIPDTAQQLLGLIDDSKERADIRYTEAYIKHVQALQSQLAGVEEQCGVAGLYRSMYFSFPVDGKNRDVLVASSRHIEYGDIWHIIVNDQTVEQNTLRLEYAEYAVARDTLLLAFDSSESSRDAFCGWTTGQLGKCARIRKLADSFDIFRGNESRLLVPAVSYIPHDEVSNANFNQEMAKLAAVMGGLRTSTHDEFIRDGTLF